MDGKASLPWSLRLSYAAGQFPEGIKSAAFGFYLLFYYNQVLGLDARLASLAIFLALLFVGIFAPPDGLGQSGLFLWLLTFTAATRTAMTFYTVPYMSMGRNSAVTTTSGRCSRRCATCSSCSACLRC